MPTYEYKCESCGHLHEVFAKMSDPAPSACPECGATQLTKVLFPVAVHYKGSGFYSTDYAGSKRAASTTSSDAPASGSDSTKSSESSKGASGGDSSSTAAKPSTSDS